MALTYVSIASTTVSSNTGTITFDNIPQTYTDLVLKISARSSTNNRNFGFRFNNNSGNIYSDWLLYGTGSGGANVASGSSRTVTDFTYQNISTDASNSFAVIQAYIPFYTNTVSTKTFSADSTIGVSTTAGFVGHTAQSMNNTSAISRIDVIASGDFTSGTTMYLYGILRA